MDKTETTMVMNTTPPTDNDNITNRWSLFRKDRSSSSNNNNKSKKMIMAKQRVRVEPKTFFANERTFIQWVSAALFLVTIAILLLEMGAASMTVSIVMVAFSAVIIMYSMAVYYRRLQLLSSGEAYGYIDHVGPIVLALSVLVGVFILFFHLQSTTSSSTTTSGAEIQQSNTAVLVESSKQCYRHSLDINPMDFQASDLFLDDARGFMLIPTGSEITAIRKHNNNNQKSNEEAEAEAAAEKSVMVLANVPGSDFEAITYTPNGRIFAIREMKNSNSDSQLLEFDWNKIEGEDDDDNELQSSSSSSSSSPPQLELKQTWTIQSKGAEGIAWVHDKKTDREYLYIASDDSNNAANDSKSDRGEIQVYNIPYRSSNEKKLNPERSLNRKLINFGLEDSKIGSLQFFEGLLYVLHDNARVVRAWDISTGIKKFEFELPLVDGGYNKQWEGIALERHNKSDQSRSLLRQGQQQQQRRAVEQQQDNNYPSDSSLVLHLALDTPAQIWSIAVSQDESSGQIALPPCASS